MSRETGDQSEYYQSKGGQLPVRWTAPEVKRLCIFFLSQAPFASIYGRQQIWFTFSIFHFFFFFSGTGRTQVQFKERRLELWCVFSLFSFSHFCSSLTSVFCFFSPSPISMQSQMVSCTNLFLIFSFWHKAFYCTSAGPVLLFLIKAWPTKKVNSKKTLIVHTHVTANSHAHTHTHSLSLFLFPFSFFFFFFLPFSISRSRLPLTYFRNNNAHY